MPPASSVLNRTEEQAPAGAADAPGRGLTRRPDWERIAPSGAHVAAGVERPPAGAAESDLADVVRILEIGLNHEQQHQELMLTDILHAFAQNPIAPAYDPGWRAPR